MATLNMEVPFPGNYALYDYIQRRLIEANINKDIPIDEACQLIMNYVTLLLRRS